MKSAVTALALALGFSHARADEEASPLNKVVQMLADMEQKTIKAGKEATEEYEQFHAYCKSDGRLVVQELHDGSAKLRDLKALDDEQTAIRSKLTTKTEELATDIATDDGDLKEAMAVRQKEARKFPTKEEELMDTVKQVKRGIAVIEKLAKKGSASMLQVQQNADSLVQAFSAMIQSSIVDTAEVSKLNAFIQSAQQASDAEDNEALAPPSKGHDGSRITGYQGIIETLEDLLTKAEAQLDALRAKETEASQEFDMLRGSLNSQMKIANKDMDGAKKGVSAASEKISEAEGDIGITKKDLSADDNVKRELERDCAMRSEAYEQEMKSRTDEVLVLRKAREIIKEAIAGSSFSQLSFLQASEEESHTIDPRTLKVVRLVRELARSHNSSALVQLSGRVSSVMRSNKDPFERIKVLIADMIERLQEGTSKDQYCKQEMAKYKAKEEDKGDDVQSEGTKIDQARAKSAKLKEQVSTLQNDLFSLAKSQSKMDEMRKKEKATYDVNVIEAPKGLMGIQQALKVLKGYFAKAGSSDASTKIIGLLEDAEAKTTAWLSQLGPNEDAAQAEYERMTKENEIDKKTKEKDIQFKTKEAKELDKSLSELNNDKEGAQEEFQAVDEYLNKLKRKCSTDVLTFEEKQQKREQEIVGLKNALEILNDQTSLIQRRASHRRLRGDMRAMVASA